MAALVITILALAVFAVVMRVVMEVDSTVDASAIVCLCAHHMCVSARKLEVGIEF